MTKDNNEQVPPLPTLTVAWDAETQVANLLPFDSKVFKTWDMVIAVLEMAKHKAEVVRRLLEMQSVQQQAMIHSHVQQAMEQRQADQIGRRLRG